MDVNGKVTGERKAGVWMYDDQLAEQSESIFYFFKGVKTKPIGAFL